MAGAGVRLFTAGSILTASQVNDYLMDQAVCRFADASARDAAFGGIGEPVLSEGRICYLDSDNKIYVYTGSAWVELASDIPGTAGQVVVYNSSGAPTATTLSGDVTINSSGVTAISSGVVVNADISSSAAIEQNKIADSIIDTKTANYTLVLTDKNKFIEMNAGSANTVSIPTDASVNFPIGSQINITQYGTGKTQIVAVTPATTTIRSTPGAYLRAQYSSATLVKRATNEWYLIGDLSAS